MEKRSNIKAFWACKGFTQETINKNGYSRKFLLGISTTFNNEKGGDPRLQTSGMTSNWITTNGFTLIELLVVVLIIAILAAVALPQYNKAVKRAQGREVYVALEALDKALADYYLEHGSYEGVSADTLSVKIPDLKNFTYYYPANSESSSQQFKGCWAWNETSTKCRVIMAGMEFSWEKGERTTRIVRASGDMCSYLEGAIEQVQTPSSTQTHCVVQF